MVCPPSIGELILLKNQTDLTQNGLFTVTVVGDGSTAFILQRWNVEDKSLVIGLLVFATAGAVNANMMHVSLNNLVEVGVTELNFIAITLLL